MPPPASAAAGRPPPGRRRSLGCSPVSRSKRARITSQYRGSSSTALLLEIVLFKHQPNGDTPPAGIQDRLGNRKGVDLLNRDVQRFNERVPEYTFEGHAYLADDEHGVGLQRSRYKRGDETLETNEVFVVHFRDGKISEAWFFSEKSDEVDAFLG